jgi:hypothetical protein
MAQSDANWGPGQISGSAKVDYTRRAEVLRPQRRSARGGSRQLRRVQRDICCQRSPVCITPHLAAYYSLPHSHSSPQALARWVCLAGVVICRSPAAAGAAGECPLMEGGLNRSTQHFILNGKDGVFGDVARISSRFHCGRENGVVGSLAAGGIAQLGERLVSRHRPFITRWPRTVGFVLHHGVARGWH